MARQVINRGTSANDGTGDNLRDGAGKVNNNFTELYTAFGDGSTLSAGTFITTTSTNTLQNKSISLGSNTITGTTAQFNTALTDSSFATLAGSEVLSNKTIDTATNTISNLTNSNLSGSAAITNANISTPRISIGGITFNLGDTDATPALDLSDATNYPTSSLTGTITNAQLAGSIVNAKLSNSSITIRDDSSTEDAVNLGETLIVTGAGGLVTSVSGNTLTLTQASASLTYSKGTATGDGSTLAFTINSGRAEDDILVFVNGICLVPTDDYTISGTTLTFNTAPAVSAEITFRYLPI